MPWVFKAEQTSLALKIGETGLAFFEATNTADHAVAGQASYNVTPDSAGGYFTKIACFCFTAQILQPGQTVQMPVTFFVDPAMVQDPEGKYVKEITLSYTFHEIPLDVAQAALAGDTSKPIN
jgi:cytochrome c oxidase assembly protein subunit 11